jgi:3-oxoacyl-[acyl-carrier-protein] synthase III
MNSTESERERMNGTSVGILGTGKYVPERRLTNQDLEQMVETNDEWIVTRTGIRERRIAAPDQATSDLAYEASIRALDAAGITADQLDLIIVATITPDMFFPSTACLLQEKLGAKKAAAFDLSAACSGFIYGLANATGFIQMGMYRHVLVVGAECLSRITDYSDRNTSILFGDGAGAVVVGEVPSGRGFKSFKLGADGAGGELLRICGGGSRMPSTEQSVTDRRHFIEMNGRDVFKFAVRVMGSAAEEALSIAGIEKADIDLLIPHQANIRIIQSALERLNLSEDKCMINLDRYGNVSAASIPLALAEAVEENRVKEGDHLVLVGFGGGLTWGASVLVW